MASALPAIAQQDHPDDPSSSGGLLSSLLETGGGGPEADAGSERAGGANEADSAPLEVGEGAQEPAELPSPKLPSRRVIEEIVVTAQKREQAISDVPISLSVLDDQFIADQALTDVRDAMLFVPNVQIDTATAFGGSPRCRGFSLDVRNQPFEPPCGIALDGIPYTAVRYLQTALFDVRRVEVLRGPQGTTFGKNTVAGLINLVTNDPTDDFTGHVDLQLGELGRQRFETAIGGAILPGLLNFRVAGIADKRDGFMRNTTARITSAVKRPGSLDREGFRVKLDLPSLYESGLTLSYERVDLEALGLGFEAFDASPAVESYIRQFDPSADFVKGNLVVSEDQPTGLAAQIDTFQLDWSYDRFPWRIDAVAAHSRLDETTEADADSTAVPGIRSVRSNRLPTTTLELRAFSPSFDGFYGRQELFGWKLGSSELLAGFFYQKRIGEFESTAIIRDGPFLGLLAATEGGGVFGVPLPPLSPDTSTGGEEIVEQLTTLFDQDAETIAGFAEFQWFFAEQWMLQYAMRLSHETKDGVWNQTVSDPSPAFTALGAADYSARRSRSEFEFQPKVSLNYKPIEAVSLFAHWARGFKGGGFNEVALQGQADQFTFDPESANEWGIDAKTTMFGGLATLNVSLFRLDLDDFQVLTIENLIEARVENAATARAQGVEADLMLLPTEWLTVIGTVGLNDTEFLEFPINTCPTDSENTDDDDDPRCDASGRPFAFAPEWSNTLTTQIRYPLEALNVVPARSLGGLDLGGIDFTSSFTLEFIDVHFLEAALNPRLRQPSFLRLRASIGFRSVSQGWSVRVMGENLGEQRSFQRALDAFQNISSANPEPPRVVFGQLRWEF